MTTNSQDPRIPEILHLASRLTGNEYSSTAFADPLDYLLAMLTQLTEDKKNQAEEEQRIALINFAIEHVSDAVYWIDSDTIIRDVNAAACRLFDISRDEFIGKSVADIDPMVTLDEGKSLWNRIKESGSITFESVHQRLDGSTFPVEVMVVHVSHEGIDLNCAFVRDITDRVQSDQTLRESEKRFRSVFEQAAVGMCYSDLQGYFLRANQKLCDVTGYTNTELLNMSFKEITHPDDLEIDMSYVSDLIVGNIDTYTLEKRYIRKDKTVVWVQITVSLVRDNLDEPQYFIGVIEDITERKRIEITLREREGRLQYAEKIVKMGHYTTSLDLSTLRVSDGLKRIWGYELETELTSENVLSHIHSDDYNRVITHTEKSAREKNDFEIEYRIIKQDQSIATVRNHSEFIYDENIQDYLIFGATIDITAQKQIEEALRQSLARYEALIESQLDLFSRYTPDTNLTYVNDAYCQFYGKTREELIGTSFTMMVAPEFREYTIEETKSLVENPRTLSGEYLNYSADGRAFWIHWIIQPVLNENDQVVELQAVGRDITSLKQTQEALSRSEDRYRTLVENQQDLIIRFRPDATLTYVNDAYCKFNSKTREELIGKSFLSLVSLKLGEDALQETEKIMSSLQTISGEYLNHAADGSEVWIHWIVQPILE